jgi:hypothetical protein
MLWPVDERGTKIVRNMFSGIFRSCLGRSRQGMKTNESERHRVGHSLIPCGGETLRQSTAEHGFIFPYHQGSIEYEIWGNRTSNQRPFSNTFPSFLPLQFCGACRTGFWYLTSSSWLLSIVSFTSSRHSRPIKTSEISKRVHFVTHLAKLASCRLVEQTRRHMTRLPADDHTPWAFSIPQNSDNFQEHQKWECYLTVQRATTLQGNI